MKSSTGVIRATLLVTAMVTASCAPDQTTLPMPAEPSRAAQTAPALTAAFVPNAPNDPNIQYVGRWDFSTPTKPSTAWPGTGMVVAFAGTSIRASFTEDNSNNRLFVSIDGAAPVTIRLARGTSTVILAQGLSNTTHLMRLVKKTEGCCGAANFAFLGFQLDAGKTLVAPPARPSLRLEFYGDSHAAGYSAECSCNSQETGYKNAAYAYPALVGTLLNAEVANQSWSGIGIFNGYATKTMPEVFDRTLQSNVSPLWDFSRYTPDAVVVNLGDNDVLKGATKAQIMTAMQGFVTNQLFVSRGTVAVLTGGAQSGSRYVQLNPKAGYAGMYQATDAIPSRVYTASASLRKSTAGTATARLRLEFRDQAQKLLNEQMVAPTVGNAWGTFSVSGRAPAGTWQVRVVAVSDNGAVIDVDTIVLTASN